MIFPKSIWTFLFSLALPFSAVADKDKKEEEKEEPKDPNRLFYEDFEDLQTGSVSGKYFVIEGDWTIAEKDDGKVLKLSEQPLVEASLQLGKSMKEGATVTALISAERKRRSFPRFGVALHGMSGFRLRAVPARKIVELVRNDEPVASAPFEAPAGASVRLKLRAEKKEEKRWEIRGWAWTGGGKEPSKPLVTHTAEDTRLSGKASVTGTPYAGLPIYYDEIEVRRFPELSVDR